MKMKKAILMSIVALAVSVAFVCAVMAEQKAAPATTTAQVTKLEKFNGVVEKVDETTKDVLVQFRKDKMTFSLDDHTKIVEGKKEMPFSNLKKGMWVSVEYKKEENKLIAESLSISTPKVQAKQVTSPEVKKENPSEKTTGKK
jgi:Cu/Ag efflux protein CusF